MIKVMLIVNVLMMDGTLKWPHTETFYAKTFGNARSMCMEFGPQWLHPVVMGLKEDEVKAMTFRCEYLGKTDDVETR